MTEEYLNIDAWLGIDNTSEPAARSIPKQGNSLYFSEIDNIDIDDNFKPHRRSGYQDRLTQGANTRSLWAAPSGKICLFASGTSFCKLNADDTNTTLITPINPNDRFAYVEVGNNVYFSDMTIVGYIDTRVGTTSVFPTPTQTYKVKMVGGQILEYHYGKLYAANGSNVFYSDSTILTQMDSRKNAIAVPSRVVMMKSVVDGMYVSDNEKVYFWAGRNPDDFVSREVLDIPAIEGMSESVMIKRRKASVKVVYFVTKKGVYAGYPEGIVVHQQEGKFKIDNLDIGCAIIKNGDYQQFMSVGKLKVGTGDFSGRFDMPTITFTGTMDIDILGDELMVNGGMEEGNPPTGWIVDQTPETFERSSDQKHGGSYSIHIVDDPASFGGFFQNATFIAGKNYRGSCWYYLVSGTLYVGLDTGNSVAYTQTFTDTGAWHYCQLTGIAGGGIGGMGLYNNSETVPAEFYIDDVSIKEVL